MGTSSKLKSEPTPRGKKKQARDKMDDIENQLDDSKEVSRTQHCKGGGVVADNKGAFDTIKSADNTDEKYITRTPIEWHPIRHPRLPVQDPPRYYVNKLGDVRSNVTGKLKPLKPVKGANPSYGLGIDKNKRSCFKLEEIMAWTFFAEKLASIQVHYIYHKDGQQANCSSDNLIICNLSMLQSLEITKLEKMHPETQYTVVKNVHDTMTFGRYLVSNTGNIYSLIKRRHLSPCTNDTGYQTVSLSCDTDSTGQISKRHSLSVHSIVIQSFMKARRAEKLEIDHINAKKQDNSFQNLAYVTKSENIRRIYGPTQTATRNMLKEQGVAPRKYELQPLPPVTKDTEWRPIGTLPWNGLSFNQYEVSSVGHVRKIGESVPLAQRCVNGGYPQVSLYCDKQDELASISTRRVSIFVSRLVAGAFLKGYSESTNIVRRLNGNRQDNRAENLEWVEKTSSLIPRRARKVVVALVDDMSAKKTFPSIAKAKQELSISYIRKVKFGQTLQKEVTWDGKKMKAVIQVY